MEFQILDRYFHMGDIEVSNEYSRIVSKNILKGGDYDRKLVLIIDVVYEKPRIFTDKEISIIASIVKMRKAGNYIYFSNIYPVLKDILYSLTEINRESDLKVISELLSLSINRDDYYDSIDISSSPTIKNFRNNLALSPSNDNFIEESSRSYKPEIVFGWIDNDSKSFLSVNSL